MTTKPSLQSVVVILYTTPPLLCILNFITSQICKKQIFLETWCTEKTKWTNLIYSLGLFVKETNARWDRSPCEPESPPSSLYCSVSLGSAHFLFHFVTLSHHLSHFSHSLSHSISLPLSLTLFLPLCFAHVLSVLANNSTHDKVWWWEPVAPCMTSKPRSPSLKHPTVLSKKQQRDPCLNTGKNKRQLMQPHYVSVLYSYELWPQLKMTLANYGQLRAVEPCWRLSSNCVCGEDDHGLHEGK